jgi:glycosyltransferase involved in cell wall biosynthesis
MSGVLVAVEKSPWPATTGGRVRLAELWKAFEPDARRLVLFAEPSQSELDALDANAPSQYSVVGADGSRSAVDRLDQEAAKLGLDVIWASGVWVATGRRAAFDRPLIVDAPSLAWKLVRSELGSHLRMLTLPKEGKRFVAKALSSPASLVTEQRAWSLARAITPCSPEEQAWLGRSARAKSTVVPNGCTMLPMRERQPAEPRLLFVGTMHYPPNAEAVLLLAERILPSVRRQHPGVVLDIVGAGPAALLERLRGQDGVSVHGFVDDLTPIYEQASHAVIPLRRRTGTNVKVLDAIAHGVPVVATRTAIEGFPALIAGRDVAVVPDWRGCADLTVTLLRDRDRSRAMALSAATTVQANYTWDASRRILNRVVEGLRGASGPNP